MALSRGSELWGIHGQNLTGAHNQKGPKEISGTFSKNQKSLNNFGVLGMGALVSESECISFKVTVIEIEVL